MQEDGGAEQEVARRTTAGWNNWKNVTGVSYDRRVQLKFYVKGKVQSSSKTDNAVYYGNSGRKQRGNLMWHR